MSLRLRARRRTRSKTRRCGRGGHRSRAGQYCMSGVHRCRSCHVSLSLSLSLCLSISLSLSLSICIYIYIYIYFSLSLSLSLYMIIYIYIYIYREREREICHGSSQVGSRPISYHVVSHEAVKRNAVAYRESRQLKLLYPTGNIQEGQLVNQLQVLAVMRLCF